MDPLESAIRDALVNGRLPCERAFALASRLGIPVRRVGETADGLDVRISRCQLGLFGFEKDEPGSVAAAPRVSGSLREAIETRQSGEKLPCAAAWAIAAALDLRKLDVAAAAESLNVRVSHCQLGCF